MPVLHRLRSGAWICLLMALALVHPRISYGSQVSYLPDAPLGGDARVQYYTDASGQLRWFDLAQSPNRYLRPLLGSHISFGLSRAAYWLHWSVRARSSEPTVAYLSIAQPTLDDVQLYVLEQGVLRQQLRAGDQISAREQPIVAGHPVLPITVIPGHEYELYLRVASRAGALLVPIEFESAADLAHAQRVSLLLNGIIAGVFGALFIYNLLLYSSLRHPAYLYYVLLMPLSYLACTAANGFGPSALYPMWVWPSNQGLVLFAGTAMFFNLMYARALLDTAAMLWLDRILLIVAAVALAVALCCVSLPIDWLYALMGVLVLLVPSIGVVAGIVSLRKRHPQARFYLMAQAATWSGLVVFALSSVGIIGYSALARQGLTFAVTMHALLLSLALADRIRGLQHTAERAEQHARHALERRRQDLERGVAERTRELEQARRHAEYLATTDALTGIYNRRGLLPLIEHSIEQSAQAGQPLSLICFDLDHFKRVNDDFGHAEGDRVLCDLVVHARKLVRQSDLFGRTGGEEFLLALEVPLELAAQRAEEMRCHLQQHLRAGQERVVTASFGVAALGQSLRSLDALHSAADAALYRAKNRGRNRVEVYREHEDSSTLTRAIMRLGMAP